MSSDPATDPTEDGPPGAGASGDPGEGVRGRALAALRACGAEPGDGGAAPLPVASPIDGEVLFDLEGGSAADARAAVVSAVEAFGAWRAVPPTARAALVELIARGLDRHASALAELIAIETGKPLATASAEVEAAASACAEAAGAAAQMAPLPTQDVAQAGAESLSGALALGRFEARRPLGPVAVLGSFDAPLLQWATVAPVALASGDPVVWLPAAPLVATAVTALVDAEISPATTAGPAGLHSLVLGEDDAAEALADAAAIELVVRPRPTEANVAIVAPRADLDASATILTAATLAGAGRSAASLHLVFAHASIAAALERRLAAAFATAPIGDPLAPASVLGPLPGVDAYRDHLDALQTAEAEGGELIVGGEARDLDAFPSAYYVEPALIRAAALLAPVSTPVLFLATYADLDEALARRDTVARRWSALLGGTAAERATFLAAPGSDRGFVAVGTCPTEADLAAASDRGAFTRAVAGSVVC